MPQLLNLGHGNAFEFGDNGNLGVQVLFLVAFFDEEGPPGEEQWSVWGVPGAL